MLFNNTYTHETKSDFILTFVHLSHLLCVFIYSTLIIVFFSSPISLCHTACNVYMRLCAPFIHIVLTCHVLDVATFHYLLVIVLPYAQINQINSRSRTQEQAKRVFFLIHLDYRDISARRWYIVSGARALHCLRHRTFSTFQYGPGKFVVCHYSESPELSVYDSDLKCLRNARCNKFSNI